MPSLGALLRRGSLRPPLLTSAKATVSATWRVASAAAALAARPTTAATTIAASLPTAATLIALCLLREAGYALMREAARPEAHLEVGRLLVAEIPAERRDDAIFEIVNQLKPRHTIDHITGGARAATQRSTWSPASAPRH